jgi:hypothetical protein
MAWTGPAFLALWNDVEPARDAEYNCWHTFEHVPERVGIEGFLAGRRYVARERTDNRYFTLYALAGLGALAGPEYAAVVDRPTEWSASMRPSLRNFQRNPCATLLTLGGGDGGCVATFRIGAGRVQDASGLGAVRSALEPHLESSGIVSMHLGLADADATFPLRNMPPADLAQAGACYVLLVEGIDRDALDSAAPQILETIGRGLEAEQPVIWKAYDLAFAIERAQLCHPTTHRQPARPELRRRWLPK